MSEVGTGIKVEAVSWRFKIYQYSFGDPKKKHTQLTIPLGLFGISMPVLLGITIVVGY